MSTLNESGMLFCVSILPNSNKKTTKYEIDPHNRKQDLHSRWSLTEFGEKLGRKRARNGKLAIIFSELALKGVGRKFLGGGSGKKYQKIVINTEK